MMKSHTSKVFSSYTPTNTRDETVITIVNNKYSSFARPIPKHNVLFIGGENIGKYGFLKNSAYT